MSVKSLRKILCKNGSNVNEVQHMKEEQRLVTLEFTSLWGRASGMSPWVYRCVSLVMEYVLSEHLKGRC